MVTFVFQFFHKFPSGVHIIVALFNKSVPGNLFEFQDFPLDLIPEVVVVISGSNGTGTLIDPASSIPITDSRNNAVRQGLI